MYVYACVLHRTGRAVPTFFLGNRFEWEVHWIPAVQSYCCKLACFREGDRYRDKICHQSLCWLACLTEEFS